MRYDLPGQLNLDSHSVFKKMAKEVRAASLRKLADRPMLPTKEQKPCDIGLFSDDANQIDLIEMLMEPLDC